MLRCVFSMYLILFLLCFPLLSVSPCSFSNVLAPLGLSVFESCDFLFLLHILIDITRIFVNKLSSEYLGYRDRLFIQSLSLSIEVLKFQFLTKKCLTITKITLCISMRI